MRKKITVHPKTRVYTATITFPVTYIPDYPKNLTEDELNNLWEAGVSDDVSASNSKEVDKEIMTLLPESSFKSKGGEFDNRIWGSISDIKFVEEINEEPITTA